MELVFSCKARGNSKLSYQWFKDGTELPGKNESTLLLKSVTLPDFGCYKCVASCKDNPSDVVESSPAELDVTPRDGTSKYVTDGLDKSKYFSEPSSSTGWCCAASEIIRPWYDPQCRIDSRLEPEIIPTDSFLTPQFCTSVLSIKFEPKKE